MFSFHSFVLLCCLSTAVAFSGRSRTRNAADPFLNTTTTTTSPLIANPTATSDILPVHVLSMDILPTETPQTAVPVTKVSPAETSTPGYPYVSEHDYPSRSTALPVSWLSNYVLNATLPASTAVSNATCTVQIPSASAAWWYPATYSHKLGSFSRSAGNFSRQGFVTLLTSTVTFDVSSALKSDSACTMAEVYIPEWGMSISQCEDYKHKPTAAATSVAYRKAATAPIPWGNVVAMSELFLYDFSGAELPSATTTISAAPDVIITETSATPFVHFTAYEVAYGNRTETFQLQTAHAYPYWLEGVENGTVASGPVPDEFLQQIPQSGCDAGQLQATVTVVVVVDLYYENKPGFAHFIIRYESSATGFNDPPVVVLDHGSMPPTVMTDWDIPDQTEPTLLGRPQPRPDSAPVTRNSNMEQPKPPLQTLGVIGTEPVVVGLSDIVVGSQALRPGSAITVAGTPVSMLPPAAALVIGETTSLLPQAAGQGPQTVGTIGTHAVVVGPSSIVVIGSQTIRPGEHGTVDIDGVAVSFAPDVTAIAIGTTTSFLPSHQIAPARPPPLLTIGSATLTPDAQTHFVLPGGQTLTPGGTASLEGTFISLAPSAEAIVIGTATHALSSPIIAVPEVVFSGVTFTPLAPGPSGAATPIARFLVSSQTLIAGGPAITIPASPDAPATTLSLAPSLTALIVNGTPKPLPRYPPTPTFTAPPVITLDGTTLSLAPGPGTRYVLDGQTLTPGGAVTVAGETVELAQGATAVRWGTDGVWKTGSVGQRTEIAVTSTISATAGTSGGRFASGGGGASPSATTQSSAPGKRVCSAPLLSLLLALALAAMA